MMVDGGVTGWAASSSPSSPIIVLPCPEWPAQPRDQRDTQHVEHTAIVPPGHTVAAAKLTEGITWAVTGIGIGMALGSFASGYVIDAFGPASGFLVSGSTLALQ